MTSIDQPEHGMTSVHAAAGGMFVLRLDDCTEFAQRCSEQYEAILDCSGAVNLGRIEAGERPVLVLAFRNREPLLARKKT